MRNYSTNHAILVPINHKHCIWNNLIILYSTFTKCISQGLVPLFYKILMNIDLFITSTSNYKSYYIHKIEKVLCLMVRCGKKC